MLSTSILFLPEDFRQYISSITMDATCLLRLHGIDEQPPQKGDHNVQEKQQTKQAEVSRFVRITILPHEPLITEPLFKAFFGTINYVLSDKR